VTDYKQEDRILEIQTDLGTDLAILTELEGVDAISRPFEFTVTFVTDAEPRKVADLLGSAVRILVGWPETDPLAPGTGAAKRPLHGHIRRLMRGKAGRKGELEWRAEIVPALWFLSRTTDCRIFQEKTIPDIISEVLKDHGVTAVRKKLTGGYETRDYVVQYRETALDFVSRLMEQEGIHYWHEHGENEHTLVLADNKVAATTPAWHELEVLGTNAASSIDELNAELVIRSGKWTLRDFNFETPSLNLEVSEPTTLKYEQMKRRERFDYPGLYDKQGAGVVVAKSKIENEETFHEVHRGRSSLAGLSPGIFIQPKVGDAAEDLLVVEVHHHAEDYSHWTPEDWGREQRAPSYSNEFLCIPKNVLYRPEHATPRPFVHGPQTAIVTGGPGDEICTDKYGRVKVQFHWDRVGQKNDKSSCWIRVSQGWAGQGWGQFHIPRVGQEVIVDFLEGDPDRPIITGRVYNAEQTWPYALPGEATKSGIKTNSSKGGGGYNEVRFEDKKGSEEIWVHAEKDLNTVVENNETRKVGGKGIGNRTTDIKNDEITRIKGNKTTEVTKNFKETITGTETRDVTGAVKETFLNSETRIITGPITETITNAYTMTISAGSFTMTASAGINFNSPAPVMINSAAVISQVAPSHSTTATSWFKAGNASGDAYQFKMGIATTKLDIVGIGVSINTSLKFDVANFKMDNFQMAIKTGGIEIKNKALSARSQAFVKESGLKLYTA
jgi:type VI secretion system secreted protein VgrG